MTESEAGHVDMRAWLWLLAVYNLVMLAVGVPVALYAYQTVHRYLPQLRDELRLSWSPASVVLVCLLVGLAANLMFPLGPLADLCSCRWACCALGQRQRVTLFGAYLALSLLAVAWVWFECWALPVSLL